MADELEFIRGNQKSCIRIPCEAYVLSGYEYQMCMYNRLMSIIPFQYKNINGEDYIYFDISGMQSLDIFLQTQKLKRPVILMLARSMIKLCGEISEYALSIEGAVFLPKYIMLSHTQEQMCFLYDFRKKQEIYGGMEELLECCIEHLDYKDDMLMEQLYQIYERLLSQKQNFSLKTEMEALEKTLTEDAEKLEDAVCIQSVVLEDTVFKQQEIPLCAEAAKFSGADMAEKEHKQLKKGLLVLLFADIAAVALWRPLTILKLAFCISFGGLFAGLWLYMDKKEKIGQSQAEQMQQENAYIEEYIQVQQGHETLNDGTQIISVEDIGGVLYNLQNMEPQYIYIGEKEKIIGKDLQHVQVCIEQEGISRIHARIIKEDGNCIIEDLNSTNGTWINGKPLQPRMAYILKEGDKVRFAALEYIFR